MNFTQLIIEDALINEVTNQRRLYSAAVASNNDSEAQKIWDRINELKTQIKNIKEDKIMKDLSKMTSKELKEMAKELKVPGWWNLNKAALIDGIQRRQELVDRCNNGEPEEIEEEDEDNKVVPIKSNRRKRTTQKAPVAKSEQVSEEPKENAKGETKKPNKHIKELTYNGETKSIKEWAEELEMPWPTLYDRVNRNGWSTEDAIETPLGQRRPK